MTRKTGKTLITAGLAAALVGTGYAAWQFNDSVEKTYTDNAVVTNKNVDEGVITLDNETFYLVIDQNFLGWSLSDSKDATSYTALTLITPTLTLADNTDTTLDDFNYTCSFDGSAFKDYLVFGDFATTWTSDVEMSLPTVSWKDGMKPTKESQYDTMEAAIGSASVTFTFTAAIKD